MEIRSLNGEWKLLAFDIEKNPTVRNDDCFEMNIPGEIHQALMDNARIANPYLEMNSSLSKWVSTSKWKLIKDFTLSKNSNKAILKLSGVRAKANIYLNGNEIGFIENEFKLHYFDITEYVQDGENTLTLEVQGLNGKSPYMLNPVGILEGVTLILTDDFFIRDFYINPTKSGNSWCINTKLEIEAFADIETKLTTVFKDNEKEGCFKLKRGIGIYTSCLTIAEDYVEQWNVNGYGKQHLYPIHLAIGAFNIERFIAFRSVSVKKSQNLAIEINGQAIFMKGCNWRGTKPLPNGTFSSKDSRLLEAMTIANMNMVRVPKDVGYEREAFYNECDRLGLAVWQTLPDSLEEEEYTLLSIKSHPSIVLWGVEGKDCDKLARREQELDPTRPVYIEKEENHYYPKWLYGDDFNAYHKKSPDFISEFGLPSFPSRKTLLDIAGTEDMSLTSIKMEHHEQKEKNIEAIFALLARNFDFPLSKVKLVYLSQAQQASAIMSAVMGWRALMPYTMGTLYTSLNDTYPSISNSSIDYYGRWKLLHYAAKRFFANLMPLLFVENDKLLVYVVNDSLQEEEVELKLKFRYFNGKKKESQVYNVKIPSMSSVKVREVDLKKVDRQSLFAYAKMQNKNVLRERTILLEKPKSLKLENPNIKAEITKLGVKKASIKLTSSKPAFWVSLDSGSIDGVFSDNFIAIRQTAEKCIIFDSVEELDIERLKNELVIMDLYSAMH